MATYSFKNVGTTATDVATQLSGSLLPIGIKTPLQLGTDEGILAMHFSLKDQLRDNLKNLLLTNFGERLNNYSLGANLRPLLTELVSDDDFDTAAIERIKTTVSRWMSYIDLDSFSSEIDVTNTQKGIAARKLTIVYNIPALNVSQQTLQIVLYAI